MKISLDKIKDLSVTVMGLGINGGGAASATFFAQHGADVTVTDLKTEDELKASLTILKKFKNIRFVLGEHKIEDFKRADIVIKNPAVKREGNKYLQEAKQIETDISIFATLSKAPILAVTGSKGKSSTVSALYHGLKGLNFKAFLGGNITVSPLSFLMETTKTTPVVLELSSWQLADLKMCTDFKPKITVITPIMPDHQNWYHSMAAYVADKRVIYQNQDCGNYTICNYDDSWGKVFAAETKAKVFWYSLNSLPENLAGVYIDGSGQGILQMEDAKTILLPSKIKVPGVIMKQNVLNAGLALALYGACAKETGDILKNYSGIPHRLEFFYESGGIKFYNDSAATIPEAAAVSLNAFKHPILICGGTDKALDFTALAENAHKAKHIFLLKGSGTEILQKLLDKKNIKYSGPFPNLETLLLAVKEKARQNDEVVLSPAAASFELFKNEFDRGDTFKQKVKEIF